MSDRISRLAGPLRLAPLRRLVVAGAALLTLTLSGCFEIPLAELDRGASDQPFKEAVALDDDEANLISLRLDGDGYIYGESDVNGENVDETRAWLWEVEPDLYIVTHERLLNEERETPFALPAIIQRKGDDVVVFLGCFDPSAVALAEKAGASVRSEPYVKAICSFDSAGDLFDFARDLAAAYENGADIEEVKTLRLTSYVE